MDNEALAYLAHRLEAIAKGPFCDAAVLVRKVMASTSPALQKPDAEHARYHTVWEIISQALDHEEYDLANEQAVYALWCEMAGRVLNHRLHRGWLRGSETSPTEFPSIDDFM
ncbi:hypothetical protein [Pseudomonas savastanoi]|uniref:Uncharacterized protein n=1 Tax=Pseudomonas savastanoi pv. glycinea TaxID=318 RepID=A0A3M3G4D4_PSESG|nr:hypothetical protein [Pseudomonas savastanoi]RMM69101.1 hypothetical protein ALQ73_200150 [Pseudomonas savastanoi pv. glycinea]